jgi:hypothetical protein
MSGLVLTTDSKRPISGFSHLDVKMLVETAQGIPHGSLGANPADA